MSKIKYMLKNMGFTSLEKKRLLEEKNDRSRSMEDRDSMSDENGQPSQYTETDEIENEEQSEEEQPPNGIQSEQVQQEMELPSHGGLMCHSPIQIVHIRDADTEEHEEPGHGGKIIKLRRLKDIRNIETPKSTGRNINKNKKRKVVSPEY